ncbi:MAG: O-methyltransferase, partial [Lachnospiraceae bacterium]|nr:O-methyltransferase [Lachnospiraceae bacterium]
MDEKSERVRSFIDAYIKEYPLYIEELKDVAKSSDVPIIMDSTRDMIKLLQKIKKPKHILELGTAVGYSTLVMSEYTSKSTKIDTVENYKPRITIAKKNIKLYDKYKKITLYDMDVSDFLNKKIKTNKKTGIYDFVFLDAAKA